MIDFVVNPAGASGRTGKEWEKIETMLAGKAQYRVHYSSPGHGIEQICRELTQDGPADLVIVGGDGSMNEAVNGIADFEHTRIGLIPCGSGNDLAKDLAFPKQREELIRRILEGKTRRVIDIGEVICHSQSALLDAGTKKFRPVTEPHEIIRRFNISCGLGFDAAICAEVELSRMKEILNKVRLGKLVYLAEAFKTITRTRNVPVTVRMADTGEETAYPECLFIAGMNHRFEGGGFQFCPNAADDDGLLDFCIGNGLGRVDFLRIFPYAYSGAHVRFKGVHQKRSAAAEIRSEVPLWLHTDGEIRYMSDHVTMRIAAEKLKLLV